MLISLLFFLSISGSSHHAKWRQTTFVVTFQEREIWHNHTFQHVPRACWVSSPDGLMGKRRQEVSDLEVNKGTRLLTGPNVNRWADSREWDEGTNMEEA